MNRFKSKNHRNMMKNPDAPLYLPEHGRPFSRRDFLGRGLALGTGAVIGPSILSLFSQSAHAALSADLNALKSGCGIATQGAGKIPFISFDLAGGASIAGSNVLVGKQGGQLDLLTTAGYSRMGIPGDMVPSLANAATETSDFIDTELGLAFHSDSQFLRGIKEKTSASTREKINGAIIPARSENDTGNNPHNPMYAINKAGADGALLTLIGSRNTDSGGNSVAPDSMIKLDKRPTKVDRPSDVTGLVDTGKLVGLLDQSDAVAVMESIHRISAMKTGQVTTDEVIKDLMQCGYVKSADLLDRYGDPAELNPSLDTNIIGDQGIFNQTEYDDDREFQKIASIMKLVINGYAGAGTITIGGYDYHTGDRAVGEIRDLRAGRCMGAALEYAARNEKPLMLYVFSDGSVSSNGTIDDSEDGRGKGVWTTDNSSTAASFFLVYSPDDRPELTGGTPDAQAQQQQIGFFRADGSVETASSPAANNVNLLVETVALNYMALHGETGQFAAQFPNHGLGNSTMLDSLTAFNSIVNGTVGG